MDIPPPPSVLSPVPQPAAFTQPFSTLVNAAVLFCFSIHRHTYTNFAPPETPDEPLARSQRSPSCLGLSLNLIYKLSVDPSRCHYQNMWMFIVNQL